MKTLIIIGSILVIGLILQKLFPSKRNNGGDGGGDGGDFGIDGSDGGGDGDGGGGDGGGGD